MFKAVTTFKHFLESEFRNFSFIPKCNILQTLKQKSPAQF